MIELTTRYLQLFRYLAHIVQLFSFFLELFRTYSLVDEIICCVGDLLLIEIGDLHLESFSLLAFVVGIRIFLSLALFDDATCDDVR